MNFAVLDIEAENWVDVFALGYYDGKDYILFEGKSCCKDFLTFISYKPPTIIYAHNGGRYDFLFLLDALLPYRKSVWNRPENILCIGSSIVSFEVFGHQFRDSLKILPGSLAKILPMFGMKKLDMDYEHIKSRNWRTYLESDCVQLYRALSLYFEYLQEIFEIKPALTIASTAMKIYRKHFNRIPYWGSHFDALSRKAYLGGRCEIFKCEGKGISSYDINSMYPYVMYKHSFPVGKPVARTNNFHSILEAHYHGVCEASVYVPDCYVPMLPIRLGGKMLFLSGNIDGTFTLGELRNALDMGYKLRSIKTLIYWKSERGIFGDFVGYIYSRRKQSSDEAEKLILKLIQNSLYGKFAQRIDQEDIVFIDSRDEIKPGMTPVSLERGIFRQRKQAHSTFIMPHISAHVTSFARLELLRYLDEHSYYCDTDSVFTSRKLPCSKELGAMKLEEANVDARFFAPKLYYTNSKVKAKGFELSGTYDERRKQFSRIVSKESISFEKVLSFKQCCIRREPFGSKKTLTKSWRAAYDKRMVLPNGDTRPYTLAEWRRKYGDRKT